MGNVFPLPRDDTSSPYPGWATGIIITAILLGLIWFTVIIIVVLMEAVIAYRGSISRWTKPRYLPPPIESTIPPQIEIRQPSIDVALSMALSLSLPSDDEELEPRIDKVVDPRDEEVELREHEEVELRDEDARIDEEVESREDKEVTLRYEEPREVEMSDLSSQFTSVLSSQLQQESLNENEDHLGIVLSRPLTLWQLAATLAEPNYIEMEYRKLPSPSSKREDLPPDVEKKNRYANVLPALKSRVLLRQQFYRPLSSYINANFIRGADGCSQKYILTQGPLDSTAGDFWRMIWEYKCLVIVMTTLCRERGIEKSYQYWLDDESIEFDGIRVTTHSCVEMNGFLKRRIELFHFETGQHYWITQFQIQFWPHQGVPDSTSQVINFLDKSRLHDQEGLVVVHCSAGIGRSAVLVAIDQAIQCMEAGIDKIDVMLIVSRLRQDRHGAVQSAEQYRFIHKAIYDYAMGNLHLIPNVAV